MAVVSQLVKDLLLLIREDDVGVEGLHHEQRFTQSTGTFTKHLFAPEEGVVRNKNLSNTERKAVVIEVIFHSKNLETNLVRLHGDDGAKGEDEGVNVFHV